MALSGPQKTVAQTVGVVVLMGSLAWAAVPFYDWFCRVTGFGGTTGVAEAAPEDILDRTVTVRFDASKAKNMAWEFKPVVREMEVRIGETGLAFYEAYNPTDRPIAGQASYNVAPYSAGGYFQKIACFCFEEQVLQPGERVEMPVTFFVDPEMVEDLEAKYVHTITLSYTFYEIDLPEGYAALEAQAETNTN
ncbi:MULTISPECIES: cytochrome c oxidase assembly protein [unclassified Ruegeria]|jgi:cytochrome c oxidase assembly protein subunit 11|uniref:cytochrome c oxidase assembly protein n=1 Tax=unclassified Ruegeria TaxID=2625375 RepID=UPI0012695EBF|nr:MULTISPECIES: cytochrome c oxidase assembly protein [unclassified Ruegeria]NOC46493.1 cytochrome c oxidase assembly protein [Ruegeria sp. HKCCD7559]NOC84360.1 cytochrome c oxidase assembly protein [Ruegeria sp. HKCCD6428]NOC93255.1 cytochrome c oxidase assembly protein [Ruegeria sp. HKCCD6604]NOD85504.1 cytochrome c oxidase assembly protein [Ruegeria sp. HKCCD6119]NOD97437.1 cytochrome c oxidase assembly protein [Ruegeria sp. HKCCD6228]